MSPLNPTPSACRISFRPSGERSGTCLAEFAEPFSRIAVRENLTAEQSMAEPLPRPDSPSLLFLFVPAGMDFSPYEAWFKRDHPDGGGGVIVDLLMTDRILWRPGRAVMYGSAERRDETAEALAIFTFFDAQLRELENGIRQHWASARQDMELSMRVERQSLGEWPRVVEMGKWATLSRMKFAALDISLDVPSDSLSARARRVVMELANMTRVRDRLRGIDDQLEVFQDLYELANDRLAEYSHYQGEYKLEVWIIVLLLVEVVVMLGEIVMLARK